MMIDPVSLGVGAVIALGGFLVGRVGRPRLPKPPALECSCGHGYGMHEAGNRCHGSFVRYSLLEGHIDGECACQHYDGPEPLPRSWVPPELPGADR